VRGGGVVAVGLRALVVLLATTVGSVGLSACTQGNVFSLSVGDCFSGFADGIEIADVDIVSCGLPHDSEVYSVFPAPGSTWPGASTLIQLAEDGCIARFETYIGLDYEFSEWYVAYLHPTRDSWERLGDREITCVVQPEYGNVSWSARDSNR